MGINTGLLAPPLIEGIIPAFYLDDDGAVKITVPFSANRAVGQDEFKGFSLKIKEIQGSGYLFTVDSTDYSNVNSTVTFTIKETTNLNLLSVGQFYKLQIAYINKLTNSVGHYSTVGISKYTTRPTIEILELKKGQVNSHCINYTGFYSQEGKDITEKIYSYRFIIYNSKDEVYYDTGEIVHNSSMDEKHYESKDSFYFNQDFLKNEVFKIVYSVTTNNGLTLSSAPYRITQKSSIYPDIQVSVVPILNFDNGYIEINYLTKQNVSEAESVANGGFVLSRACLDTNYTEWEEIEKFYLQGQYPSKHKWKDFTIQQGKTYVYSLQQFSDAGLFSERILSEPIYADFEDAFLFDGVRQLKIRYNSKVSSFKRTLLESKLDTLGSKHPFILKNGNTDYHEFPISGLITCLSDENNLFIDNKSLGLNENLNLKRENTINNDYKSTDDEYFYSLPSSLLSIKGFEEALRKSYEGHEKHVDMIETYRQKSTNLTNYMYYAEREFKLEVLKWLTNGEPKLFRSPTEGNYLVRLMNVSLSPNDQLGRMLHNFSATAYEVADYNYDNLNKYKIIAINQEKQKQLKYSSLPLSSSDDKYKYDNRYIQYNNMYYAKGVIFTEADKVESVYIQDMIPGDIIYINNEKIVIGSTGAYELKMPVYRLEIPANITPGYQGLITYSYYGIMENSFNRLENVEFNEVLGKQFIGYHSNLMTELEDAKHKIGILYNIIFKKRNVGQAYYKATYEKINNADIDNYNFEDLYVAPPNPRIDETHFRIKDLPDLRDCFFDPMFYESQELLWATFLNDWTTYNNERAYFIRKNEFYRDLAYTTPIKIIAKNKNPNWAELEYYGLTNSDPLQVYSYANKDGIQINRQIIKLYRPLSFINTSDIQNETLNLNERVTTNKYICDIRDFKNYTAKGNIYRHISGVNFALIKPNESYSEKIQYFILEDAIQYLDVFNPDNNILSSETYDNYIAMFTAIEEFSMLNYFTNFYQKFNYNINIEGETLDLEEIGFYEYKLNYIPKKIGLSCGVYAEISYQQQEIIYAIETSQKLGQLHIYKNTLDEYKNKVSREGFDLFFADEKNTDADYIKELEEYREKYNDIYKAYIEILSKELNKGG